jgi:hypothetical protein
MLIEVRGDCTVLYVGATALLKEHQGCLLVTKIQMVLVVKDVS